MAARGLRRRCPRCGDGAFESFFTMKDHCVSCGLRFEREEGYWVGAMIINTTVTFATFILVFGGSIILTWPEVPWAFVLVATLVANIAIPVLFYPISKSLWLGLELSWHPLEEDEIRSAAERAELPEYRT
jgi:uncharacterized protein (DUF983 family)